MTALMRQLERLPVRAVGDGVERAMAGAATRMGCTTGQAYTLAITLLVVLSLTLVGVPPTLRNLVEPRRSVASAPEPSTPPTTTAPAPSAGVPAGTDFVGPQLHGGPSFAGPVDEGPLQDDGDDEDPFASEALSTFAAVADGAVPSGVAVADGSVFVGTDDGNSPSRILRFDYDGTVTRQYELSGQPVPHEAGVRGIAVHGGGIYAADAATHRVVRIDVETGAQADVATIPDLPPCVAPVELPVYACEPGAVDHKPLLHGLAVAGDGRVYVADEGQRVLWRVEAGAVPTPLHASIEYASGPTGLAVDDAGRPTFVVTLVGAAAETVIFRLALTPEGNVEARQRVADLEPRSAPRGLAVRGDGARLAVVLSATSAVVVIDEDGVEHTRAPAEGSSMAAPAYVAFDADNVLITTEGPPGSVLRLTTGF